VRALQPVKRRIAAYAPEGGLHAVRAHSFRIDRLGPGCTRWSLGRERFVPHARCRRVPHVVGEVGSGSLTTLVCGTVEFDHPAAQRLVSLLPRAITVDGSNSRYGDWIQSTLRFMAAEARELRPGGETVITRLADVLVIQAIREWIELDPAAQAGWLGALRDRQIGRVLTLIHRHPARPWTLESLASEVAMSRSAFAARFSELVGESAMHYVARWRMHLATTWLREDDSALGELAGRLGYQSEAAFSRAFKRVVGMAPASWRRA
jgi:AraC-like DNA-binding protein